MNRSHINNNSERIIEMGEEVQANTFIGQHFLKDERVYDVILSSIPPDEKCIEIGAGPGTLTRRLLELNHQVVSYEIDKRFQPVLEAMENKEDFEVRWGSFLDVDPNELNLEKPYTLVGNIPYHISEPLMFLLPQLDFQSATLLIGKRLANSLEATPDSLQWGRMSMLTQAYYNIDLLTDVPKESFDPVPRANGALVRLTPKTSDEIGAVELSFQSMVKAGVTNSTVAKALKGVIVDRSGDAVVMGYKGVSRNHHRAERRITRIALKEQALMYSRGEPLERIRLHTQNTTMLELVSSSGVSEKILSKPLSGISNQDLRILCRTISSVTSKRKADARSRSKGIRV